MLLLKPNWSSYFRTDKYLGRPDGFSSVGSLGDTATTKGAKHRFRCWPLMVAKIVFGCGVLRLQKSFSVLVVPRLQESFSVVVS